jgi:hypothetical protein
VIAFVTANSAESLNDEWIAISIPAIAAIAFLLIQLRVGLGRASWYDQAGMLSEQILFRPNSSAGGPVEPLRIEMKRSLQGSDKAVPIKDHFQSSPV